MSQFSIIPEIVLIVFCRCNVNHFDKNMVPEIKLYEQEKKKLLVLAGYQSDFTVVTLSLLSFVMAGIFIPKTRAFILQADSDCSIEPNSVNHEVSLPWGVCLIWAHLVIGGT